MKQLSYQIYNYKIIKIIITINLIIFFILFFKMKNHIKSENKFISKNQINFDKNFDYLHYENDIITEKMKKEAGWILTLDEVFLINGIIRKHKPKNCLEIGVARGGSSILILNAIKDFSYSQLISIDLFILRNKKGEFNNKIGYLVEQQFPELMNKWRLFLGEMPHKILTKLNIKFDLFFLDTAHRSPGEFFDMIEVLPFLNENAIVILHDTMYHLLYPMTNYGNLYDAKFMPTQIYLMSSLIGEKLLIKKDKNDFINIGVVCLKEKQENYYLNYFLLIMNIWQYMPTNEQLNDLRKFIKIYYKDSILLRIFDNSVEYNKKFFDNLKKRKYKLKYTLKMYY